MDEQDKNETEQSAIADDKQDKPKKNLHARALGKRGGAKGGFIRAHKLTPERRSEIARLAAIARWNKRKPQTPPDVTGNLQNV